ncbi:MAG: STAS domain-containing protein [Pseudomonadota bacterium]
MEVKFRREGTALIVTVTGRLDTVAASVFQSEIEKGVDNEIDRIVIDCSELDYISSAGLRSILIIAQKICNAHGYLACCRLKGLVKKVFEISKFSLIVPTFDSLEEALHDNSSSSN